MVKDRVTDIVAAGMLTSPVWVPWLEGFNQLLTTISLLGGLIWLGIQMYHFFNKDKHDPN